MNTTKVLALTAGLSLAGTALAEEHYDFLDPCIGNLKITDINPKVVEIDALPATFGLTVTVNWSGAGNITSLQPKLYLDDAYLGLNTNPIAGHDTARPFTEFSGGPPANTATVEDVPVTVPAGTTLPAYIGLEVRGSTAGTDYDCLQDVVVDFAIIEAVYKAPPAIANEYIREVLQIRPRNAQRGCVISYIAEQHAQYEKYGPKGGPFNAGMVHDDVDALLISICQ